MIKDFKGLIAELEDMFPVFATDIRKDEVMANESFFVFDDDGGITRSVSSTNEYRQEFYLSFVTRAKEKIDKFKLIELFDRHKLFFISCNTQVGKIENLDVEISMTTFTFYHRQMMCRG
ncbi:hypothetical protein [Peptostreptococcus sp.]|uniref:hypothetical protein n=1 Tax=Peptostreptococcus sp. TaxID=1262 RepID=UPI001D3E1690|nr:hypothetical protein [Peptostreptococcus sp.]MBS5596602.1 hypothetical protein [Peptostreptococcus sp.]